jgi:hypothetical protein
MFARALPVLPDSALLRRTIVNHLPRKAKDATVWFETVAAAARNGTEEFAIWCARHLAHGDDKDLTARLHLLALWVWYSEHGGTDGHTLIEHRFHPSITVRGALAHAKAWQTELDLHFELGHVPVEDMWFAPATVDGYDFVPLRTEQDIRDEAQAMQNCLRTYGYSVATGGARLWSIRKNGVRVATLGAKRNQQKFVCIAEIKTAHNKPAPADVLQAAQRWFMTCALWDVVPANAKVPRWAWSRASWTSLWRPYWLAKRRIPAWLPLGPSRRAIVML